MALSIGCSCTCVIESITVSGWTIMSFHDAVSTPVAQPHHPSHVDSVPKLRGGIVHPAREPFGSPRPHDAAGEPLVFHGVSHLVSGDVIHGDPHRDRVFQREDESDLIACWIRLRAHERETGDG